MSVDSWAVTLVSRPPRLSCLGKPRLKGDSWLPFLLGTSTCQRSAGSSRFGVSRYLGRGTLQVPILLEDLESPELQRSPYSGEQVTRTSSV